MNKKGARARKEMLDGIDWNERLTVEKEKMTTLPVRPSMRRKLKEIMRLNGLQNYEELFEAFVRTSPLKQTGVQNKKTF